MEREREKERKKKRERQRVRGRGCFFAVKAEKHRQAKPHTQKQKISKFSKGRCFHFN